MKKLVALSAAMVALTIVGAAHAGFVQQLSLTGTDTLGNPVSAAGFWEFDAPAGDVGNVVAFGLSGTFFGQSVSWDRADIPDTLWNARGFAYSIDPLGAIELSSTDDALSLLTKKSGGLNFAGDLLVGSHSDPGTGSGVTLLVTCFGNEGAGCIGESIQRARASGLSITTVPEPDSLALISTVLVFFAVTRPRRAHQLNA
jgi:hypothetical protein